LTGKVSRESHKGLAEEIMASLPGVKKVDNRLTVKGDRPAENSDKWIQMKVETALLFHRNVSETKTKVAVKDGIVTLHGQAINQAQMDLTSEYAKDVQGVKGVKNDMKIMAAKTKSEETVGEKIDDASLTAEVKISLLAHRSTSALDTHVTTMDGVVTLSGKAANAVEKDLVTKLAADIHGVMSVVNNMVISASVSSN
jgi:osmotically-inducible protein OsmY